MYLIYVLNVLNKNKDHQIDHRSKGHGSGVLSVCIGNNYTNEYENTSVCIEDNYTNEYESMSVCIESNYTNEYENMSVCDATMNEHVRT